jgi:hypothetical protein
VTVPENVPVKVPTKKRGGRQSAGPRPPRAGGPTGWRFQLRLSPSFFGSAIDGRLGLAGSAAIVQLATLCQTICSFAADIWKGTPMNTLHFDRRRRTRGRRPKQMED